MRKLILFFSFVFYVSYLRANVNEDLNSISELLSSNISAAKELALELREKNANSSNDLWHAKSNYYLGYIYKEEGDFGKAIIHYLEAIRYAKAGDYDDREKDLASIHNRCAIIFRQFKAYNLSEEYYNNGISYSLEAKDTSLFVNIHYNLSGVYRDQDKFNSAIDVLKKVLPFSDIQSKKYFDILNRLSNTYLKLGSYDSVKFYSNKILDEENKNNKKHIGYSHHLLAKTYIIEKDFLKAEEHLFETLEVIENYPEKFSVNKARFEALVDLGINSLESGDLDLTFKYYHEAETLLPKLDLRREYFELYKSLANIYYNISFYEKSKYYEDLYTQNLNEYLQIQEEIREADQRYNMDLITKRYFAEVDKQERIADILFYSKLTSGSLLVLLLIVIAYFRYQKVSLRKSIERELIALKLVE
jgi:tetratricopeptide (TPR) repeat protein